MKNKNITALTLMACLFLGISTAMANILPVANAGAGKKIGLPSNSVTLSGSASDSDGKIASLTWSKVSGGSCTIKSPLSTSTIVTNLVEGTYYFRLTVKDNLGAVDTDDVKVTVFSAPKETLRYKGTVSGANYGYSEYLPEGYTEYSNWPLIIFLHGVGETNKPDANGKSLNLSAVGKFGPIRYASPTRLNHKLPAVILAPQCDKYWSPTEIENFRLFAVSKYKINLKKIYVTGLSMGGGGANTYAKDHAQYIAALMPLSPASIITTTAAQNLIANHVSVWGDHCVDDPGPVYPSRTKDSFNNLGIAMGEASPFVLPTFPKTTSLLTKTAHFNTTTKLWSYVDGQKSIEGNSAIPQIYATFYNHGGHGGWERIYEDPNIYTWLFKQSK